MAGDWLPWACSRFQRLHPFPENHEDRDALFTRTRDYFRSYQTRLEFFEKHWIIVSFMVAAATVAPFALLVAVALNASVAVRLSAVLVMLILALTIQLSHNRTAHHLPGNEDGRNRER